MTYKEIFDIALQILLLVVGGLLVPYLKTKIGETQYANILRNAETAVEAAEQIYKTWPKSADKNNARYEYAAKYLTDKGIKLTSEELKALIHAAVLRLNEVAK